MKKENAPEAVASVMKVFSILEILSEQKDIGNNRTISEINDVKKYNLSFSADNENLRLCLSGR